MRAVQVNLTFSLAGGNLHFGKAAATLHNPGDAHDPKAAIQLQYGFDILHGAGSRLDAGREFHLSRR